MFTIIEEEGAPLVLKETFIAWVEGSVGSNQYRNVYVRKDMYRTRHDVIDDGDLACALYVSSMLHSFNLINGGIHTTVSLTEKDMVESGWVRVPKPVSSCVVVWDEKIGDDGTSHRHIGICLNRKMAVSNCPVSKSPQKHGIHDLLDHEGRRRKVLTYYAHRELVNRF
ncbi:hypothetical protein H6781_00710 [Candidatus Nomurabacteria bacterium]|nr:hypothetical protein [Candidatus Kaiserbacteria bacterium]MCB9810103.1 hypothetical protein [Candidatus Nomurabacteria bacterium]MCB9818500.1 hypothetical protein [Candidatus Nomurabacteria bacterium]